MTHIYDESFPRSEQEIEILQLCPACDELDPKPNFRERFIRSQDIEELYAVSESEGPLCTIMYGDQWRATVHAIVRLKDEENPLYLLNRSKDFSPIGWLPVGPTGIARFVDGKVIHEYRYGDRVYDNFVLLYESTNYSSVVQKKKREGATIYIGMEAVEEENSQILDGQI